MKQQKTDLSQKKSQKAKNIYDDGNIPEVDLPKKKNASNIIPDEVPRHDGPGGE